MIIAESKPIAEIAEQIKGAKKILLVGCGGCVSVCFAGGEKEVSILASALRILRKKDGSELETVELVVPRQCDPEYMDLLEKEVTDDIDCILSMGCGVGVQFIAERIPKLVAPALDTKFAGGTIEHGVWEERCGLCGKCMLYKTGGICPVTRCAKSILNGPCGGSMQGKCELSSETPCAWQLIYDRMKLLGRLDLLLELEQAKDWIEEGISGPGKVVREDVKIK